MFIIVSRHSRFARIPGLGRSTAMTSKKHVVATTLTQKETEYINSIRNEWGVTSSMLMRRLIQYFINEKISLIDLLKESNKIRESNMDDANLTQLQFNETDRQIRTRICGAEKEKLDRAAAGWDISASSITRRLLKLFVAGIIKKNEIW